MKISYKVAQRKLIYIFGINDATHKGLLKISEATFDGNDLNNRRH